MAKSALFTCVTTSPAHSAGLNSLFVPASMVRFSDVLIIRNAIMFVR